LLTFLLRTLHYSNLVRSSLLEAEAHANPQGANDARHTALQIIEDEGLIGKLEGKVFFVTGVSSSIGIETLKALHATGAHVFGTVRDVEKG
jgi:hypothetical protein